MKDTLAQDMPIISGTNAYSSKGEMVLATFHHGQDARIILDGPGTFSWITREFLHKIKDARAGSILKVRGAWRRVMVLVRGHYL